MGRLVTAAGGHYVVDGVVELVGGFLNALEILPESAGDGLLDGVEFVGHRQAGASRRPRSQILGASGRFRQRAEGACVPRCDLADSVRAAGRPLWAARSAFRTMAARANWGGTVLRRSLTPTMPASEGGRYKDLCPATAFEAQGKPFTQRRSADTRQAAKN